MNIGIVGLGLIGGSLAGAIKAKTPHSVFVYNRTAETAKHAIGMGYANGYLDRSNIGEMDYIILCVYPGACVKYITEHARLIKKNAVVIDCSGVKRKICGIINKIARENQFIFIGGHPMAGKEKSGFAASDIKLFDNATMILTPEADSKIEACVDLFKQIGFANVLITTAETHDSVIAYTSQLAHIVSSAYIKSDNFLRHKGFSAGSFRDMTRVAFLNETMWSELFLDNADNLVAEIDGLIGHLTDYREAISNGDGIKLTKLLANGSERKSNDL